MQSTSDVTAMIICVTDFREKLRPVAMALARMRSCFPSVSATITANLGRNIRLALRCPGAGANGQSRRISASFKNPSRRFCTCASFGFNTRLYLGTGSGQFRRPAALGLLLHFVPCGFRFLPKEIRSNGKERRAKFFWFPPEKQTFGTWEPGPLPRLRQVCPKQIRELKTENKTCI
jgi:hypothetical protein